MTGEAFSLDDFYAKNNELFRLGDVDKLEEFLFGTVRQLEEMGLAQSPEAGSVYNDVGCWLRGVSRYEESRDFFDRSLSVLAAAGYGQSVAASRVRLNLAGLHRLMGDYEEAERLFMQVADELEDEDDPYAYVSVLNNISLVYQDTGELPRALETYAKVLELLPSCPNADEHEFGTTHVNMAAVRLRMGDFAAAEQSAKRAIEIFESMQMEDSHLASAWSVLGSALRGVDRLDEARDALERALDLDFKYYGYNADYALIAQSLARTYAALGERQLAIRQQKAAVKAMVELFGEGDRRTQSYVAYLDALKAS